MQALIKLDRYTKFYENAISSTDGNKSCFCNLKKEEWSVYNWPRTNMFFTSLVHQGLLLLF